METTTFNNPPANDMMAEPARPQFLTVLCILTWICCAFTFISTVSSALFKPSAEKQMQNIEEMRKVSPEAADQMEAVLEKQEEGGTMILTTLITLVGLGLSAYGAFLMWKLKKTGFYLYIAGEIIPYIGFTLGGAEALSATGAMMGMSGSTMVGLAIGVMALFDGIFFAMYGVNVKHMK